MFYRESWLDDRLQYDIRQFKNKTELALHESYAVCLLLKGGYGFGGYVIQYLQEFPMASRHIHAKCNCIKKSQETVNFASLSSQVLSIAKTFLNGKVSEFSRLQSDGQILYSRRLSVVAE
jgi:hypothetical protein